MLILQRKAGESVFIGEEIEVSVLSVDAGRVRLAIQAPREVPILRGDVLERSGGQRPACVMDVSPRYVRQLPWDHVKKQALEDLRQLLAEMEDGPAAQAGLQHGDVITMLGTTTISSWSDLTSAMGSKTYKAGDTTTVTFVRDGEVMTTELTFGSTTEMPEEEAEPQSSVQQDGGTSNGGTYGYGDMEDFFNEFFGSYSRRAG